MFVLVRIRTKILLATAVASAAIAILTMIQIGLQLTAVDHAARLEASDLAQAVAYGASFGAPQLQSYVQGLDAVYKRDIVIVDAAQHGVADAHRGDIGRTYVRDLDDEVGKTILDGQARAFVERSDRHPEGASEMVVAIRQGGRVDGRPIGAVVLEYTAIHDQLLRAVARQLLGVGGAGILGTLLMGLFGWRFAHATADRLARLQTGVDQVARGSYAVCLPVESRDEIAGLSIAFNAMTGDLRASRDALLAAIEREREAAREIEFIAFHDRLTGLANRGMFSRGLQDILAEAALRPANFAVLFVDLDRFKYINDTLGHAEGDRLLVDIAERLLACVGSEGTVARLGGDEFVVTLHDACERDRVGDAASRILSAIARPVRLGDQDYRITASIGISCFPDDGADERTLMKKADVAMYQAKEDGKNAFAFYSDSLDQNSLERLAFESSLRHALEAGQFQVVYQPKVDMRTGSIKGLEALLRWHHPELGTVAPARFIPVAEETGLIVEIGEWVLKTACAQSVAWRAQGIPALSVAVNLSPRQFSDERLLPSFKAIIAQTGMDPGHLELEITESMLMKDVAHADAVLRAFKELGISLSVDDFGTGYSSLSNLKRFPVDTIKVDRSFVRDLPANEEDRAIADAIISMGRALGMTVIAEGVETQAQLEFLQTRGCDQYQGFLFSQAVSSEAITTLLEDQSKSNASRWLDAAA